VLDIQRQRGIIDLDLLQAIEQLDACLRSGPDNQGRAYIVRTPSFVDLIKVNLV
jgi:hypothetical protein